jgi:phosphatidylserine/phosphatidylglycerophosphate/cardiolipin synthase-like enzyme
MKNFRLLVYFLLLLLVGTACTRTVPTPPEPPATASVAGGDWYELYFSRPNSGEADKQRGGPDAVLVSAIDQAHFSVDAAIYDLSLWSVRDALLEAHRRGVQVRLVTESDNMDSEELQELVQAGIPVLGDRREGLMHDKFFIIDRYEVWTGSMNMTLNGAYHNDNNLLRLRSNRLAEDYLTEFEEMFTSDLFGDASIANTPYTSLNINGTPVEVYFSPDDGVEEHVVAAINGAQHSVYFMTFSLTSDPVSQTMIKAFQRGVDVAGVIERGQADNAGSDYQALLDAGVDVRLDGNPGNMHHKVILIDGQVVITGSYNFSRSAEARNDENLLVLHNPQLTAQFMQEFDRVYDIAQ